MNSFQLSKKCVLTSILFGFLVLSEAVFSQPLVIDFEKSPEVVRAAKTFGRAGPAQSITIEDGITLDGGVVLGLPSFTPTTAFSSSPNLYGTANHPSGRVIGHPSLDSSLSIQIVESIGATSIEGLLVNGLNRSGSYIIEAFSNETLVDSVSLDNLAPNPTNGFADFKLETDSQPITLIQFSPDLIDGEWDYFIDTITIYSPSNSAVPIPAGIWLFMTGILTLFSIKTKFKNENYTSRGYECGIYSALIYAESKALK